MLPILHKQILVSTFSLTGCSKDNPYKGCFKLRAIYVNKGENPDCHYNVFNVADSPIPKVPAGSAVIIITGNNHVPILNIGSAVYFRIISYEKNDNADQVCPHVYSYNLSGSLCE